MHRMRQRSRRRRRRLPRRRRRLMWRRRTRLPRRMGSRMPPRGSWRMKPLCWNPRPWRPRPSPRSHQHPRSSPKPRSPRPRPAVGAASPGELPRRRPARSLRAWAAWWLGVPASSTPLRCCRSYLRRTGRWKRRASFPPQSTAPGSSGISSDWSMASTSAVRTSTCRATSPWRSPTRTATIRPSCSPACQPASTR